MGEFFPGIGIFDFADEYGEPAGDLNSRYAAWEIDDADPSIGDIYTHLQSDSMSLSSQNDLADPLVGDAALALAFDISDWLAGETILARFMISGALADGEAGLKQLDSLTDDEFHFSGSLVNIGEVPIPGTGGLMLLGLITIALAGYRQRIGMKH